MGKRDMTDTSQLTEFCVFLTVKPGLEAGFLAESFANREGARGEDGNLRFDIYRSTDNPLQFLFVEAYDSVDAVTKHRETSHFLRWLETAGTMLAEPRRRVAGSTVPTGYEPV